MQLQKVVIFAYINISNSVGTEGVSRVLAQLTGEQSSSNNVLLYMNCT